MKYNEFCSGNTQINKVVRGVWVNLQPDEVTFASRGWGRSWHSMFFKTIWMR